MSKSKKKQDSMHRFNTRIRADQRTYIKTEVKRSKGETTEGELTRELLDLGITSHKAKNNE